MNKYNVIYADPVTSNVQQRSTTASNLAVLYRCIDKLGTFSNFWQYNTYKRVGALK